MNALKKVFMELKEIAKNSSDALTMETVDLPNMNLNAVEEQYGIAQLPLVIMLKM